MKFEASGIVDSGDAWRCMDGKQGAIFIGETDIVDEIYERKWAPAVRAFINGTLVAEGPSVSEVGWGYSEYTPMDQDKCNVGTVNLIDELEKFVGKEVTLLVTDEPA